MLAWGGVVSTSAVGKGKKGVRLRECVGRTNTEKPIEILTEWEFRERFRIPNGISMRLVDGDPVPTKKESFNAIVFSKKKFNAGLCFHFPSLFN